MSYFDDASTHAIESLFLHENCAALEVFHVEILEKEKGSKFYTKTIQRFSKLLKTLEPNSRTRNAVLYAHWSKNTKLIDIFRDTCLKNTENGDVKFAVYYTKAANDFDFLGTILGKIEIDFVLMDFIAAIPQEYVDTAIALLKKKKLFFELWFFNRDGLSKAQQKILLAGLTIKKLTRHFDKFDSLNIKNEYSDIVAKKFFDIKFDLKYVKTNPNFVLSLCIQYFYDLDSLGNPNHRRKEILQVDRKSATLKDKVFLFAVLTKMGYHDYAKDISAYGEIR